MEDREIPISCIPEQASVIPCSCNIPGVLLHVSWVCRDWWGGAQAALPGMMKTDRWFRQSVLIQTEICEPEVSEHLSVCSPPQWVSVAAVQLSETLGITALSPKLVQNHSLMFNKRD